MAKKENTTKSFVLRVDAATMEAIEKWAADEFRSTNGQLQWIINEALRKSGRLKPPQKKRKQSGTTRKPDSRLNTVCLSGCLKPHLYINHASPLPIYLYNQAVELTSN